MPRKLLAKCLAVCSLGEGAPSALAGSPQVDLSLLPHRMALDPQFLSLSTGKRKHLVQSLQQGLCWASTFSHLPLIAIDCIYSLAKSLKTRDAGGGHGAGVFYGKAPEGHAQVQLDRLSSSSFCFNIYLDIGCVGSCCTGLFSSFGDWGPLSSCSVRASPGGGFSGRGAPALGCTWAH